MSVLVVASPPSCFNTPAAFPLLQLGASPGELTHTNKDTDTPKCLCLDNKTGAEKYVEFMLLRWTEGDIVFLPDFHHLHLSPDW